MEVKEAGKEDINEICLLLQELFELEKDFSPDYDKQRKGLEIILDNPQYGYILLLKEKNKILGIANLLITVSTAMGTKVIILEDFIIKREERGKGRGKFFMNTILDFVREKGYSRITLLVDKDNVKALKFYSCQGFVKSNMECWRYFL
ncbi:MAG: GNAT family N-acetyltransferase [Thermoanaerobacteraceae bacterium]|nr:GNAT family N-acetyltransferase [Thermoanaerobacteraceae bacterium]